MVRVLHKRRFFRRTRKYNVSFHHALLADPLTLEPQLTPRTPMTPKRGGGEMVTIYNFKHSNREKWQLYFILLNKTGPLQNYWFVDVCGRRRRLIFSSINAAIVVAPWISKHDAIVKYFDTFAWNIEVLFGTRSKLFDRYLSRIL